MSMTDPIADMLTRIRNGLTADKANVLVPASSTKKAIAAVLREEGYIGAISDVSTDSGHGGMSIELRYHQGSPVISEIKRISKPGRRVYRGCSDLPDVVGGLGVCVVSTSKGIMTGKRARQEGVGGEVLLTVY